MLAGVHFSLPQDTGGVIDAALDSEATGNVPAPASQGSTSQPLGSVRDVMALH